MNELQCDYCHSLHDQKQKMQERKLKNQDQDNQHQELKQDQISPEKNNLVHNDYDEAKVKNGVDPENYEMFVLKMEMKLHFQRQKYVWFEDLKPYNPFDYEDTQEKHT